MRVSLIIPVLNEEQAIPLFYAEICSNKDLRSHDLELLFVDDGSSDRTNEVVRELIAHERVTVRLLEFSRNFGKEAAVFAGLEHCRGDVAIPIDVDLQDPVEVIPRMLACHQDGFEVVLAKRHDRLSDSVSKRVTARLFYKVMNSISDHRMEEDVGDFRLISRPVIEALKSLPENKVFMKGLLSWVGFRTTIVEYVRMPRSVGHSRFNGWKLWNLALEGITSFSTVPLRIWTYIGTVIALFSIVYGCILILQRLIWGNPVPGYTSLIVAILFLGGVQLIGVGIIGEYIGRIYMEAKRRPRYLLRRPSE